MLHHSWRHSSIWCFPGFLHSNIPLSFYPSTLISFAILTRGISWKSSLRPKSAGLAQPNYSSCSLLVLFLASCSMKDISSHCSFHRPFSICFGELLAHLQMNRPWIFILISHFMLSITQPHHFYQVFLSQGLGLGLAIGLMFLPSVSIIAHYFSVRRSLIMGIAIAGSRLFSIIHNFHGVQKCNFKDHLLEESLFLSCSIIYSMILASGSPGASGMWLCSSLRISWNGFHCEKPGPWPSFALLSYLGFIFLGLLLIANLTMKPRFPGRRRSSTEDSLRLLKKLFTDLPYMLTVAGCVAIFLH